MNWIWKFANIVRNTRSLCFAADFVIYLDQERSHPNFTLQVKNNRQLKQNCAFHSAKNVSEEASNPLFDGGNPDMGIDMTNVLTVDIQGSRGGNAVCNPNEVAQINLYSIY